jgi:hypothetical protein
MQFRIGIDIMLSKIIWFVMLLGSLSISLAGCSDEASKSKDVLTPKYQIVKLEDVSYGLAKRYNVRTRVDRVLTIEELELISKSIIEKLKTTNTHNALAMFFYLPNTDINGVYTSGKAEWAPYGEWARADEVPTGSYSKHKLKLSLGNILGVDPEKVEVPGLPVETKKKIFFDLVLAQDRLVSDRGLGDTEDTYSIIAKNFGVDEDIVRKIATEGIVKGWPMP